MKTTIIILSLIPVWLFATVRPEQVPSRLTEIRSGEWYVQVFESWDSYLEENPTDKAGWVEYFKAGQFANMPKEELLRISTQINDRFGQSPESYFVQFKLSGWTSTGVSNLSRALGMSAREQFPVENLLMAEFNLDKDARRSHSLGIYQSRMLYPSLLNYSYNVLMSVEDGGVLFTQGENTTVPMYILQDVMNVRNDIEIINYELVQNQEYLEKKLNEIGLNPVALQAGEDFGQMLAAANPQKKCYYALTMPRQNLKQVEDRLYVVGLTSQLSESEIDNYSILKKNIEKNFLLDYLSVDFNGEPKTATGRKYEANYTVPFLMLKQYYDETGDTEKSNYWEKQVLTIAERNGLEDRVKPLLGKEEALIFKPMDLDVGEIEKNMMQVKGKLYANKYEVTNEEYRIFLKYLMDNDYENQFQEAAYDFSECDDMAVAMREAYHVYPIDVEIKTSNLQKTRFFEKSQYKNYPTLDISFDGANMYCKWLTDVYNAQEDREYQKVVFRLPTRQEWTMAALGYSDFQSWVFEENTIEAITQEGGKKKEHYDLAETDCLYPWAIRAWEYRNTVFNKFRCLLANVRTPQVVTCPAGTLGDGFRVTSPVGTYFANEMGLFDVIGNVAEMIDEKAKAMGGSWNHSPEESTIHSVMNYDMRSTDVGFRVFMEVIEE